MADIVLRDMWPACSGCGTRMDFTPSFLNCRNRGLPYSEDYRQEGLRRPSAAMVADFAREHRECEQPPEPRVEVTAGGVSVIDWRRR